MNFSGSALIIDDDASVAEMVGAFLQGAGYTVVAASNGFQALRLAREIKPDVILCDMKMPHMAGSDVLRELAADPATAGIPRLLMTGIVEADRSHAHAFLLKPFQASDVLTAVQRAIATGPGSPSGRWTAALAAKQATIPWAG
jgi:CheY-like chemotaxis protein